LIRIKNNELISDIQIHGRIKVSADKGCSDWGKPRAPNKLLKDAFCNLYFFKNAYNDSIDDK